MSGINTGHASVADAIEKMTNLSYLNPSRSLKIIIDRKISGPDGI